MNDQTARFEFDSQASEFGALPVGVRALPVHGEVSNISPEGCCVRLVGLVPEVGARVIVQPDAKGSRLAVVRWIAGDLIGAEFENRRRRPRH